MPVAPEHHRPAPTNVLFCRTPTPAEEVTLSSDDEEVEEVRPLDQTVRVDSDGSSNNSYAALVEVIVLRGGNLS